MVSHNGKARMTVSPFAFDGFPYLAPIDLLFPPREPPFHFSCCSPPHASCGRISSVPKLALGT